MMQEMRVYGHATSVHGDPMDAWTHTANKSSGSRVRSPSQTCGEEGTPRPFYAFYMFYTANEIL